MLLCNKEQKNIDHSATDPDGDKLVYSLVAPFSGANPSVPMPLQAPAPPYFPVQWISGFGSTFPLGSSSVISINSANGMITVNPSIIGLFVVGVRAQEYRNGVLVGQTVRDFLFRVFDCKIVLQAILPKQEDLKSFESYCQGLTVQFENQSYGGTNYIWDFGVPGTTTDESTIFAPTFSYPKPGSYQARLIVNPGKPCTDTAYMDIKVNTPFSLSWTSEDSLCISGNSFNFIGKSSTNKASFLWDFGPNASILTSSNLAVSNVSFNRSGFHLVKLSADDGDCKSNYSDSIFIVDLPTSNIEIPPSIRCSGLTVPFGNKSANASNYRWDFGVLNSKTDVSNEFEPTFSFPNPGKYTVRLIAGSIAKCQDTSTIDITLNYPLNLSFIHSDSLCITNGLYDFDGSSNGNVNTTFLWDFGSNSMPPKASTLDVFGVKFLKSGIHEIKLIASYDVCKDSVESSVFVFSEPSIDFDYIKTLQCAPSTTVFINKSQSNSPTTYFWDFGDGGNSNLYNPSHVYNATGSYSVSLKMITSKGCIDTLYLMKQDLVQVFSQPKAGFSIHPNKVDLCDSDVEFTDKSFGATSYFYYFDNRKFTSTEANFTHQYTQSGGDYPIQVVTNDYGCSDTAIRSVFVEPFAIYIPNTFIPDGNELNDVFIPKTHYEFDGWVFQIYNKWGELLFETEHHNQGWDGTYQSKPCQDGTYIYALKFNPCDTPYATQQLTGFVNLIR
jgi:gliding motility-associated-like protein